MNNINIDILSKNVWIIALTMLKLCSLQADPPPDYHWIGIAEFSDEFDADVLDVSKWRNSHPVWGGRNSTFRTGMDASGGQIYVWIPSGTAYVDDLRLESLSCAPMAIDDEENDKFNK